MNAVTDMSDVFADEYIPPARVALLWRISSNL